MSEKSGQDPLQDEQSPQTVEHDQLKTERSKLKTERAKLKTERAKLKTERTKLNAVQGPQKSEQAPKKDNSRLFGLLEKTLMFLATLAVPAGACLWNEFWLYSEFGGYQKAAALRSSMESHVMAFSVTNLGVVLVPYPPNSEESPNSSPCQILRRLSLALSFPRY